MSSTKAQKYASVRNVVINIVKHSYIRNKFVFRSQMMKKGFTLLELLIVIGILAILSTAVVLVLNPAQLLAEARDSQRLSDLSAIQSAIALHLITVTSPNLSEGETGPPYAATSTVSLGGAPCDNFTQLSGNCRAVSSTAVDGGGWVRVNLTKTTGGSPLASLPGDPANVGSYYYAYAASNTPLTFELNARLESDKFKVKMEDDGGNKNTCSNYVETTCFYETGTEPGLDL